jgi:hypothetical protein
MKLDRGERPGTREMARELHIRLASAVVLLNGPWRDWAEFQISGNGGKQGGTAACEAFQDLDAKLRETLGNALMRAQMLKEQGIASK